MGSLRLKNISSSFFLNQSDHPVLCNNAKEPHWCNGMCHTLTGMSWLYLESTASARRWEAKLAVAGMRGVCHGWCWDDDIQKQFIYGQINSKSNNMNNKVNIVKPWWKIRGAISHALWSSRFYHDSLLLACLQITESISSSINIQCRETRDVCTLDSNSKWSKYITCVVCTTRADLESIVWWQWMFNNVLCAEKEEGYGTVGVFSHRQAVCSYMAVLLSIC